MLTNKNTMTIVPLTSVFLLSYCNTKVIGFTGELLILQENFGGYLSL